MKAPHPAARATESTSGCRSVMIGGLPAVRIGDMLNDPKAAGRIAGGCATVLIGGIRLARMGDRTDKGVVVATGCPSVLVG